MTKLLKVFVLLTLLNTLPFQSAFANERQDFSAGIVLGSPSALTAKYWFNNKEAFDVGLAFSSNDYFLLYSDYLIHYPDLLNKRNKFLSRVQPYLGIGGVFVSTTKDRTDERGYYGKKSGSLGLGIRIPFGAEWRPSELPIGVFLELAPGMSVIPATDGYFQIGLGIRYYF